RPGKYDLYDVFCAVLYVVQGGIQWRLLPSDYPKWQSVYYHFGVWSEKDEKGVSILDKVLQKLVRHIRNEDLEPVFITGGCRMGDGFCCHARQKIVGILTDFKNF
ncbi:MAG: transposase, partial [Oscillospiraceae bacterium]|nr:transposase [Oscillospiraceae bacterium]